MMSIKQVNEHIELIQFILSTLFAWRLWGLGGVLI